MASPTTEELLHGFALIVLPEPRPLVLVVKAQRKLLRRDDADVDERVFEKSAFHENLSFFKRSV